MNILSLLIKDHSALRRDILTIKRSLTHGDLRNKIKLFISKYELHESIEEDILFPGLDDGARKSRLEKIMTGNEKMHERIWQLLDQLVDQLKSPRFADLQQSFYNFAVLIERHLDYEEREFFPSIKNVLDPRTLNALGRIAELRIKKFSGN